MTAEQAKKYLERIGAEYRTDATAEYLAHLQYAHLTSVPYENMDILRGVELSLDGGDLFDKIVTRGRGGYCFELNKLFGLLLGSLGYTVTNYVARYLRGETGIPHRRHQVLGVKCADGQEFLADVGVGAVIPLFPVPFAPGTLSEQENGVYAIREDGVFGRVLTERTEDGSFRDVYGFTLDEQLAPDFDYPSFWCQHSPDSPFNKKPMLSIRAEGNLRHTLDGELYRVFSPRGVSETLLSPRDAQRVISEVFGIRL